MKKKIILLTNDNVFYLLLKTHIEHLSPHIACEKMANHSKLTTEIGNETALIIVDGKMTDISPIELIYNIRYESHIISPVWFFRELITELYKKKAQEVGANIILDKPFDPIEIARKIVLFVL